MLKGWGPHPRRSPPQSGGLSLPSTSLPWPASCVLSTFIRRNRGWGGGSGQKWQAPSLPLEVAVLMSSVTLASQAGVGAGLHGAWLSSPPHSLAQAAPTWLSGSISQPSSFFFFSTFISSDSWLLQPYGVLPTAAVQAMWHFDVSNFIFTSIDKESGRSGEGQCSPAGWPHVGPEGRAPSHGCPCPRCPLRPSFSRPLPLPLPPSLLCVSPFPWVRSRLCISVVQLILVSFPGLPPPSSLHSRKTAGDRENRKEWGSCRCLVW